MTLTEIEQEAKRIIVDGGLQDIGDEVYASLLRAELYRREEELAALIAIHAAEDERRSHEADANVERCEQVAYGGRHGGVL